MSSIIMLEFCHYTVCKRIRFRIILSFFDLQFKEVQLPKHGENGSYVVGPAKLQGAKFMSFVNTVISHCYYVYPFGKVMAIDGIEGRMCYLCLFCLDERKGNKGVGPGYSPNVPN